MAERRVRKSGKDSQGDITSLCNHGESWSPRLKADAIRDIDGGLHTYYVDEAGFKSNVRVYSSPTGKHLKTDADQSSKNNLDNLPDC